MMAMSKKMLDQEPSEIEMLLPWHAAGTLNSRDARRLVPAGVVEPQRADHARIGSGSAAACAGAVCARSSRRRHHRATRQLSSLDRRRRQGRLVSTAIRRQGNDQGRDRQPDEQAAKGEDCHPRSGDALRPRGPFFLKTPHQTRGPMIHDRASWRMKMRHAALASTLAYLSLAYLDGSAVQAQSAPRVPPTNVPPRTPTITPKTAPTLAPPPPHPLTPPTPPRLTA